jgi:hypothetical protein
MCRSLRWNLVLGMGTSNRFANFSNFICPVVWTLRKAARKSGRDVVPGYISSVCRAGPQCPLFLGYANTPLVVETPWFLGGHFLKISCSGPFPTAGCAVARRPTSRACASGNRRIKSRSGRRDLDKEITKPPTFNRHSWNSRSHDRRRIRVFRVKEPPTAPLVNRDSATRRARRLDVQSGVGELWLRFENRSQPRPRFAKRKTTPWGRHFVAGLGSLTCPSADKNRWHHGCYGWRVKFRLTETRRKSKSEACEFPARFEKL